VPDPVEKAKERTTLSKGEKWALRVAAAGGVAAFVSHGAEALGKVMGWF
jgi:hypothetical protein